MGLFNFIRKKTGETDAQSSSAVKPATAQNSTSSAAAPAKTVKFTKTESTSEKTAAAAITKPASTASASVKPAAAATAAVKPASSASASARPAAAVSSTSQPAASSMIKPTGDLQVVIDNAPINFTLGKPYLLGNNVMVPIRELADHLKADTKWDAAAKTATLSKDEDRVEITIGSSTAKVNGRLVPTGVMPAIREDRIFLPIKFLAESLGGQYSYDSVKKIATISG